MKKWIEILIIFMPIGLGFVAATIFMLNEFAIMFSFVLTVIAFCFVPLSGILAFKRVCCVEGEKELMI